MQLASKINHFNSVFADKLTNMVGSMWCAYIFCILALIGFPPLGSTPQQYVQWFAQTFLQLVLLSVIIVGQNQQSKKAEENLDTILEQLIQYQKDELTELKDDKELLIGEEKILLEVKT